MPTEVPERVPRGSISFVEAILSFVVLNCLVVGGVLVCKSLDLMPNGLFDTRGTPERHREVPLR